MKYKLILYHFLGKMAIFKDQDDIQLYELIKVCDDLCACMCDNSIALHSCAQPNNLDLNKL